VFIFNFSFSFLPLLTNFLLPEGLGFLGEGQGDSSEVFENSYMVGF